MSELAQDWESPLVGRLRATGDSAPQGKKRRQGSSSRLEWRPSRRRSIAQHHAQATAPYRPSVWRASGGPSASEQRAKREKRKRARALVFRFAAAGHVAGGRCLSSSRHAIDSRSVRARGALSVAPLRSKVWSGAALYQIHRLRGSRETDGPCRKARRIRQSPTAAAAGVFSFFFSLFLQLLCFFFLSLSLFPRLSLTHQSGEDQSGTRQRPTWRRNEIDQIAEEEKENQKAALKDGKKSFLLKEEEEKSRTNCEWFCRFGCGRLPLPLSLSSLAPNPRARSDRGLPPLFPFNPHEKTFCPITKPELRESAQTALGPDSPRNRLGRSACRRPWFSKTSARCLLSPSFHALSLSPLFTLALSPTPPQPELLSFLSLFY